MNFIKNYFLEKLLHTKIYFLKDKPELTDFISRLKNIRKVLVIVPRDRAQEVIARNYLPRLKEAFPGSRVSTLDIFNLRPVDVNWLGVPHDSFVERFRKEKFDLLIDLNTYHDTLCSYLCALIETDMRLHICEGKYDRIYNLHIRTNSNTSLEKRYSELITKMARLTETIRKAPAA